MFALYYNYQSAHEHWKLKVLSKLPREESYENPQQEIGHFKIDYDPKIVFEVADLMDTDDAVKVNTKMKTNAAFSPDNGNFMAFATGGLEEIPLKMNLFIAAHEYGHKMFDLAFAEKDPTYYNGSYELSAINEGFADFSGLMVTGIRDPLQASLGSLVENREIPVSFDLATVSECENGFYCEGSLRRLLYIKSPKRPVSVTRTLQ